MSDTTKEYKNGHMYRSAEGVLYVCCRGQLYNMTSADGLLKPGDTITFDEERMTACAVRHTPLNETTDQTIRRMFEARHRGGN